MKSLKYLAVFLLLAAMMVPVTATVINASSAAPSAIIGAKNYDSGSTNDYTIDLQAGTSFGGSEGWGGGGAGGRGDEVSLGYTGYVIASQKIYYSTEDSTLYFMYYRTGTEDMASGYIRLIPTSVYSGIKRVHINGMTDIDGTYYRTPLGVVVPVEFDMNTIIDSITLQQYFIIGDPINYPAVIDDTTYPTYPVSNILAQPFYKAWISEASPGNTFTVKTTAVTGNAFRESYSSVTESTCRDMGFLNPVSWILCPLLTPIFTVISALSIGAGLLAIVFNWGTIILAGQAFAAINAMYLIIAIVLSLEDCDDLFVFLNNLQRRMRGLLRFYMELFMAVKELIVWW